MRRRALYPTTIMSFGEATRLWDFIYFSSTSESSRVTTVCRQWRDKNGGARSRARERASGSLPSQWSERKREKGGGEQEYAEESPLLVPPTLRTLSRRVVYP